MRTLVDRVVHLSEDQVRKPEQVAQERGTTTDEVIEKALDLLFDHTTEQERKARAALSSPAFGQVWDNEADAAYDDWKTL